MLFQTKEEILESLSGAWEPLCLWQWQIPGWWQSWSKVNVEREGLCICAPQLVLPSVIEIKIHWMSCITPFCLTSTNKAMAGQEKRICHCSSEWQRNQAENRELVAFSSGFLRLLMCGRIGITQNDWLNVIQIAFLLLTHQFCSLNNPLFHILLAGHWCFNHISFWSSWQPIWKYTMPFMWLWNFFPTGGIQWTWAWARWNSLIYTTRGSLCLPMTWTFEMLTTLGICAAWSTRT